MKSTPSKPLPRFAESIDYRRTGKGGRWKYETINETLVRFPSAVTKRGAVIRCRDRLGRQWLVIGPRSIWIAAGYSWNGSSWSPDLSGVMLASLIHDAIYQFCGCAGWPSYLDRAWADDLFHDLSTTRLRAIYRIGLAAGSWACWGREPLDCEYVETSYHIGENET